MYLAYVDESGDTGIKNSHTPYFILSALVVHETKWLDLLKDIIEFRRDLNIHYGLRMREEIHAAEMIRGTKDLNRIPKYKRLQICKRVIEFEESLNYIKLINVIFQKQGKPNTTDVFTITWTTLIQRIHNTIVHNNFTPGFNVGESVMIIPDKTNDIKLKKLVRKMRVFNYVPNIGGRGSRPIPIRTVIEDPFSKDSSDSYFHQLADVNAYFLQQHLNPNGYCKRKGAYNFFNKFDNVLCKQASRTHKRGFVFI